MTPTHGRFRVPVGLAVLTLVVFGFARGGVHLFASSRTTATSPSSSPHRPVFHRHLHNQLRNCTGVPIRPSQASSLPSIVKAHHAGTTFCLAAGTYNLSGVIVPRRGDSFIGAGPGRAGTVIQCSVVSVCFDIHSVREVLVRSLSVRDAKQANMKLGLSTVIDTITSIGGGKTGLVANGVTGQAADDVVKNSIIQSSATNCGAFGGPGYCAGFKVNGVSGVVIKNNLFRHNCGSAALWLDINARGNFVLRNNTSINNNAGGLASCGDTDGIRVEISCFGTVSGNTVYGNAGDQIDIVNSNNILVSGNKVTASGTGNFGIRVLGSDRPVTQGGTGNKECASSDGTYHTFNNAVTSNTAKLQSDSRHGAIAASGAGQLYNNSFQANTYFGGQCSADVWVWWNGSSNLDTNFAGWQELGQDTSGSCS
jgi:parallel beta-helix repeat protein